MKYFLYRPFDWVHLHHSSAIGIPTLRKRLITLRGSDKCNPIDMSAAEYLPP